MSRAAAAPDHANVPILRRLSPVLIVERVESCLAFWTDHLGFALTNHVAASDGSLIFAILECGEIEIMYQSRASVLADGAMTEDEVTGHSVALFITVDSIDDAERAVDGAPVVKTRHDTFYGSTEIYVKEPGGNTVGFAQMR